MSDSHVEAQHHHLPEVKFVGAWSTLVGREITVKQGGRLLDQGRVEEATSDGRLLWLMQDGANHRRIIEDLPGRSVCIPRDPE
ncbi:hypothetical protein ACFC25_10235 [Pseudarthrobacter sp. NPDC055928]|uniref:hypothetical protein n=1 Tax=Pseudarthrobacter sp. NPDC055928 TaxID=3345661 RepID=UPI0035DDD71B